MNENEEDKVVEDTNTDPEMSEVKFSEKMTKQTQTTILSVVVIILLVVLGVVLYSMNGDVSNQNDQTIITESVSETEKESEPHIQTISDEIIGDYLADPAGSTLYTVDTENCPTQCMTQWFVYYLDKEVSDGDLATKKLSDSKYQLTWKGEPVYTYAQDGGMGDILGDGFFGVGKIARP